MHPKDADGMANSVDPDQTASSEAVWSWSALFAETYLSQYIEFVRYCKEISISDLICGAKSMTADFQLICGSFLRDRSCRMSAYCKRKKMHAKVALSLSYCTD